MERIRMPTSGSIGKTTTVRTSNEKKTVNNKMPTSVLVYSSLYGII